MLINIRHHYGVVLVDKRRNFTIQQRNELHRNENEQEIEENDKIKCVPSTLAFSTRTGLFRATETQCVPASAARGRRTIKTQTTDIT